MTTIYLRSTKGQPLTNAEVDANFNNLNNEKVELSDVTSDNSANKVVKRDASGNFSAGTITASLNGNAVTSSAANNLLAGSVGSIPYQTGVNITGFLAPGDTGSILMSNGVGVAPSWGPNGITSLNVSTDTLEYPMMTTTVNGMVVQLDISTAKFAFNPSRGSLITDNIQLGGANYSSDYKLSVVGSVNITGMIAASGGFAGNATTSTTANKVNGSLIRGSYLLGNNFDGSSSTTWAVDATSTNTASKVVARDASGNFSAGTITATLNGSASNISGIAAIGNGGTGANTAAQARANLGIEEAIAELFAGSIAYFATSSVPTGWLVADGSAVSRTTYARLFARLGSPNTGNGSTTFNLPDLRGEFIRGWDGGRGVDVGRVFGSYQADELKSHSHPIRVGSSDGSAGYVNNGLQSINNGIYRSPPAEPFSLAVGGTETRPRNIALLACIKY